jgi:Ca-activated chloride channel family protein
MKTLILICLSILSLVGGLNSKKTISGYIYQKNDKTLLKNKLIKLNGITYYQTTTNSKGYFKIDISAKEKQLWFNVEGYKPQKIVLKEKNVIDVYLEKEVHISEDKLLKHELENHLLAEIKVKNGSANLLKGTHIYHIAAAQQNTESYATTQENGFITVNNNPLSTFSIDVDAASYSNMRRFLLQGQTPPKDAIRIEEMINYFPYNYPEPKNDQPIGIYTELTQASWNKNHQIVKIGLKAKSIDKEKLPPANLVFLIDVSGSMYGPNKIDLLKNSFKLLVDQLRAQDKVSIVVYSGASGLVLPSTSGKEKTKILDAINSLNASGSTAGGEGINLAYKIATSSFIKGGNNRIILATDGDFNVGISSDGELQRLIEGQRDKGIFLTVLGFGMGNLKDSKMEILANKGNGNYAYIDNLMEAKKVFVNEFGSTFFTVAKDVKLQVEFNPAKVKAYRLIGYENRLLNNEDFNDDKKDAGELGAGHTVTALYEVIPVGVNSSFVKEINPLKYQKNKDIISSSELLTVNLRYKDPEKNNSKFISVTLVDEINKLENASVDLKFAISLASFGMLLKDSEFKQESILKDIIELARAGKGEDKDDYRAEFIRLVELHSLSNEKITQEN